MVSEQFHNLTLRRSITALFLDFCLFVVFAYLGLFFLSYAGKILGFAAIPSAAILTNVYRVICLFCFLELLRRYFNDVYIVGKEGVIHMHGRFSMSMTKSLVAYADIRETAVEQSIMARIFGFGTLKFATSGSDDFEIFFKEVARPKQLAKIVQKIIAAERFNRSDELTDANSYD